MYIERILEEKKRFTPKTGVNLVGVDTYEMPGEALYLVGHFETVEEAEKYKAARLAKDPEEVLYIYTSEMA